MVFEQFQKEMAEILGTDVSVQYGCIGTEYLKVLAVKDGKITEIGEFPYNVWRKYSCYESSRKLLEDMKTKAAQFYRGETDKMPCLYSNDYQE